MRASNFSRPIPKHVIAALWEWKPRRVEGFDGDDPVVVNARVRYVPNGNAQGANAADWIRMWDGSIKGTPYSNCTSHIEWEAEGKSGVSYKDYELERDILAAFGFDYMSASHRKEDEETKAYLRAHPPFGADDDDDGW